MAQPKWLIDTESGNVWPWTALLAKRPNMKRYTPAEGETPTFGSRKKAEVVNAPEPPVEDAQDIQAPEGDDGLPGDAEPSAPAEPAVFNIRAFATLSKAKIAKAALEKWSLTIDPAAMTKDQMLAAIAAHVDALNTEMKASVQE